MKAAVAYEAPRRQKPAVKQLKWHKTRKIGNLTAMGQKGSYEIFPQKPNRRVGIFKWGIGLREQPIVVDGKPISMDDREELKAFASSFDAIPAGTVIEVEEGAAKEACASCGHRASESPTREEWEVVVSHPPPAHRGAIMSRVGPGEARDLGDRIILSGFHDDAEAANVAASIAKQYRVAVTFGPKLSILNHAAEAPKQSKQKTEQLMADIRANAKRGAQYRLQGKINAAMVCDRRVDQLVTYAESLGLGDEAFENEEAGRASAEVAAEARPLA
jgi:hypothetical protein